MKKLSQMLESINEVDSIVKELEFKTPADFATYKKKHKMRPGTVVKVAGKDKVIDDPKKDTKPKGNKTADTLTKGLKDGGLNPYKDGPLINQALDDIGGDHSDLKKRIDTYGDNVPSSKGKSEAQYQKEIDKYKEEGEKLSNDIADAVSDKPKGKKTKSKPMPQPSDFGGDMDKYTAALNKRMKDDEKYIKEGKNFDIKQLSQISTRYGNVGTDKKLVVEAFKSGKLSALTNDWRGLDSNFWSYGAKLGIEWDKITDEEIETNAKPKKKGIEIAYIDKDVTVPMKGKQSSYYRGSNIGIGKFSVISVLKDGKPLWYTKSWKPLTNVMTVTGKKAKDNYYGRRSTIPDVDAGTRNYSRSKQFGINEVGYMSLSGIMKIPGIKFHHIKISEDMPYMGAGVKRQMRQAAQFGAAKFTTNDEFARINKQYFDDLLKQRLNDPKKLGAKVKQAAKLCQDLIDGAIGGKKPSAKIKKMIEMQVGKSSSPEADAYRFVSNVGNKLSRLYQDYGYYVNALQKQKDEEKKYGKDMGFSKSDAESYAKDVQQYYNYIMKGQFR